MLSLSFTSNTLNILWLSIDNHYKWRLCYKHHNFRGIIYSCNMFTVQATYVNHYLINVVTFRSISWTSSSDRSPSGQRTTITSWRQYEKASFKRTKPCGRKSVRQYLFFSGSSPGNGWYTLAIIPQIFFIQKKYQAVLSSQGIGCCRLCVGHLESIRLGSL